jgi:hypothetical protein
MISRVTLDVATGLAPEEAEKLRQLLYDALGEFITARSGHPADDAEDVDSALAYVRKRYPDMPSMEQRRKADEVMLRKAIARKLRRAASDVRVEQIVPVAERTVEVLPTVFGQTIEEEAAMLAEGLREAQHDAISPLAAYAAPRPPIEPIAFPVETVTVPKRDDHE